MIREAEILLYPILHRNAINLSSFAWTWFQTSLYWSTACPDVSYNSFAGRHLCCSQRLENDCAQTWLESLSWLLWIFKWSFNSWCRPKHQNCMTRARLWSIGCLKSPYSRMRASARSTGQEGGSCPQTTSSRWSLGAQVSWEKRTLWAASSANPRNNGPQAHIRW